MVKGVGLTDPSPSPPGSVLVRKYGGSSLAGIDRIQAVAKDIRRARDQGHQVVVVVSAMGKTTDDLAELARRTNPSPPRRELDMLLSVGERITMSLLSMALAAEGCPAISFTGSQCGIITDNSHNDARILEVKGDRVREALADGFTVVVAGFQGVSREREITTLGRGGSDTTAVALAAALQAVRCEILKDVDGVMSADPRLVPDAHRHENLSWDEMRQIASSGCGVVHIRAVEYAAVHQVPLTVRSSFHDGPGTTIGTTAVVDSPGQFFDAHDPAQPPAPCRREVRYRPLVMNVDRNLTRIRLTTDDDQLGRRWRDLLLGRIDPAGMVTEWLDSGEGFRWEVLARRSTLDGLREALEAVADPDNGTMIWQDDLACISLTGGRPDSWLEVQRHVSDLLRDFECPVWRMRADGSALRILVTGDLPPNLPKQLHAALLPA
ncbi:MAG: aspartate kinase [Candidatus Krumholzibacteria bacterium]|nr:aspartate kinase [Candidatus Krumholzibacteria bacterium]